MAIFGRNEDLPDEEFDIAQAPAGERVELGDRVRDVLTGWEGIASTKTEHLNGCLQFGVEMRDGNKITAYSFDEQQLEVLEKRAFKPQTAPPTPQVQAQAASARPGGATRDISRPAL